MKDVPARAARAGTPISIVAPETLDTVPPFDLVVTDVPCSGSGAWRRQPEARWRLDAAALDRLVETQARILREAARHVAPGGRLAYITCSLLDEENGSQIGRFLSDRAASDPWTEEARLALTPLSGGDGFFLCQLRRESTG
jgi:16S rRNA (cytosine967-C5)-methyltransferase